MQLPDNVLGWIGLILAIGAGMIMFLLALSTLLDWLDGAKGDK